jgi:hypothetical protein
MILELWQSNQSAKRFSVPTTVAGRTTANAIPGQAGIDQKV